MDANGKNEQNQMKLDKNSMKNKISLKQFWFLFYFWNREKSSAKNNPDKCMYDEEKIKDI